LTVLLKTENLVFCFDLDDTLYKEIDFLKSAYKEIAQQVANNSWQLTYQEMLGAYYKRRNPFAELVEKKIAKNISMKTLLSIYRNHFPEIELTDEASAFLKKIKFKGFKTALITDGRSITQRNKLRALGLEKYFDLEVISEEVGSEKPGVKNFKMVEDSLGKARYIYIADNYEKDFVTPNKLGWITIALRNNGQNIHNFDEKLLDSSYLPGYQISSWNEIKIEK
jgi:putative hydrolase of the HAD superfamily